MTFFSSGIHVQNTQLCYIDIHVPRQFAETINPSSTLGISPNAISSLALYPKRPQLLDVPLSVAMCSNGSTHTYENMQCLVFCSCVRLLKMMVSSFIHVPAKDINSSFFMAAQYFMVYLCHIFFIQSITGGHLSWSQVFVIVNSAAINTCVHVSL